MDGRLDGLKEKVRIPPSAMLVVIGKHEKRENGMTAQIFLASSAKRCLIRRFCSFFNEVCNFLVSLN